MPGRPPKPKGEARDAPPLRIRLTTKERLAIDRAAEIAMKDQKTPGSGVTATWARKILLDAALKKVDK